MTIDDQIRDKKLQHDINRETAKISTLSSGKINKYEHVTGEEILPFKQKQIIKQAKKRQVIKYELFTRSFSKCYFIINANFTKISIDNEITFRKASAKQFIFYKLSSFTSWRIY